jgi:hypothetical protein
MTGPLLPLAIIAAAVVAWPGPALVSARDRGLYCLGLVAAAATLIALAVVLA